MMEGATNVRNWAKADIRAAGITGPFCGYRGLCKLRKSVTMAEVVSAMIKPAGSGKRSTDVFADGSRAQ
jgi:hypothetical protein